MVSFRPDQAGHHRPAMITDEPCLWTRPTDIRDERPVALAGIDALELAELLAFTADALGWRGADAIRDDLAAHLRRWAIQLHPTGRPPDGAAGSAGILDYVCRAEDHRPDRS